MNVKKITICKVTSDETEGCKIEIIGSRNDLLNLIERLRIVADVELLKTNGIVAVKVDDSDNSDIIVLNSSDKLAGKKVASVDLIIALVIAASCIGLVLLAMFFK